MMGCLCVLMTWVSKWLISGRTNKTRKYGFILAFIVSILWVIYFSTTEQNWLIINSIVMVILSLRGLVNNNDSS
jgi:hypothetical protein